MGNNPEMPSRVATLAEIVKREMHPCNNPRHYAGQPSSETVVGSCGSIKQGCPHKSWSDVAPLRFVFP
jgi:hypothetical protein